MREINLGRVTAYADAVNAGYTGTREEFAVDLANAATYAAEAGDSAAEAKASEDAAALSASTAAQAAVEAAGSVDAVHADAVAAQAAKTDAIAAKDTAVSKAGEAANSASAAGLSAAAASASETAAGAYANTASSSATSAIGSASAAAESASAAEDSATEAASALGDVTAAKTEALAAIQTKGEETLESIPEDYTTLRNDVSSLKSDLIENGIIEPAWIELGDWVDNSYINTNVTVGATVNITPVESNSFTHVVVQVEEGAVYKIEGSGGNNARLWAFTDSEYQLISKASYTSGHHTEELTAPSDGFLIVNSSDGTSIVRYVKKYQYISELVNTVNRKLDTGFYSLNDVIKNSNPGYINIGNVGDTIDYTPVYNSSTLFGVFDVSQGDTFKITGAGGIAPRLWCFVDANDIILSRAVVNLSVSDLIIIAPADGKLIINTYFKNYNIRKQLNDGGIAYAQAVEKAGYNYRNNGLDVLSAFSNITCCGDSLTASVVYTKDNGDGTHQTRSAYKKYPWILGQKIGAEAESVATGGYSATDWWNAYSSRIISKENHLVIIYLGTNGGLTDTLATDAPGADYTQYANTNTGNYCKMVAKALEVGAKVLLIEIHHGGGGNTFVTNDVIEQIADKFNVAVVNVPELQERKYHAFPDNTGINDLHLNDLGYAAFAEALIRNVGNLPDEMMVRIIPD